MDSRSAYLLVCLICCAASSMMQSDAWADATNRNGEEPNSAEESPSGDDDSTLDSKQLSAMKFRSIGPAFMSGRIADIAVDPIRPHTWYVAAGSGGVWKTTNSGTTWSPIFDKYSSYSIGCVAIDPSNSSNVWVGTGENVAGRHVGIGDGIYFSSDAGKSFKNLGLKQSEHIAKIVVHPKKSDVVYVACQGPLWNKGGERGLYKTTDGGKTWNQVLAKGPYTGVTDVVMHPDDPEALFAATYQKHRTVAAFMAGGPESGIHKSTDGGKTWTQLSGGIPAGDKGKIALAISPQKPNVVYAAVELPKLKGGFFRSDDNGQSFKKMSDYVGEGTGPHYYQEIWCDPHQFDSIYHANVVLGRSTDGGKTFQGVGNPNKHVDNHAVAFHPTDPDTIIVGCDGGLYVSHDRSKTYRFASNLPLTQFYKISVGNDLPFYNVVGGTQDNSTQYGPTATNREGISNRDWRIIIGGDGHDCAIDPKDPNIIYGESQQGYIRRFDRLTGQATDIRPQPKAGETRLRFNWDSPIEISFHDNKRLYFGSKKLLRSDDRGNSWQAISPDLSRNENRLKLPILDQYWGIDDSWDLYAMSEYNNITSIGESPIDKQLIYVGTDDGLIQITEDGGETWRKVDLISGLPEMAFVNDIKASRHDADTVYVCCDNHKYGDYRPFVLKSTDRGHTWEMIINGIPDRHLCWRIIQDHEQADLLFLATEYGVFATINGGQNWFKFSHGLPTISVRDLEIQRRENDLVIATFGRGIYVLDDYSALRQLKPAVFKQKEFQLFDIKDAKQFPVTRPLGGGKRGSLGSSYFVADNPAYGATLTYYNPTEFKSTKAKRKEKEQAARKEKKEIPYPTVEELATEKFETTPELIFTIRDSRKNVVNRLTAKDAKGLAKITWNLRNQGGQQIVPGEYSVSVDRVNGGESTSLLESKSFQVVSYVATSLPTGDRKKHLAYYEQVREFRKKFRIASTAFSDAKAKLDAVEKAIDRSDEPHYELVQELVGLRKTYDNLERRLRGSSDADRIGEELPLTISQRIQGATSYYSTLGGPTQTQRDSLKIARKLYAEIQPDLSEFVDETVKKFVEKARKAGVEGLPGESVPK